MNFILALLYRNLIVARSDAKLILIRVVVQPAIYLFVFGHVIGRLMPTSQGGYGSIMAPGIVAIAVVSAPFVTLGGYVLAGCFFRTLEEWLLAPVSLRMILAPERPDKGQEVFSLLMMLMTFFGCTFYSYDMLETPFRWIALLLPTTYISEGLRAAYAPTIHHLDMSSVLAGLILATVVLLPLADFTFRRRLGHFTW